MGRLAITPLFDSEKEPESRITRPLHQLARTERVLLLSIRLWAARGQVAEGVQSRHAAGDWRQAFIASLEPAQMRDGRILRVQIIEGMFEDVLADFSTFLAILLGGEKQVWRFHHPQCLSVDPSEAALLDALRLAQCGETAAAMAMLRNYVDADRAERSLRYLGTVVRVLQGCGLGLPLALKGDAGLSLVH